MRLVACIGAIALFALPVLVLDPFHECGRHSRFRSIAPTRGFCRSGERSPSTCLKTLTSAQADFRVNDRNWNGRNDYWRGDIAGLYALEVQGHPIKLIELSVAAADDRATMSLEQYALKSPKAGFWFPRCLMPKRKTAAPTDSPPAATRRAWPRGATARTS